MPDDAPALLDRRHPYRLSAEMYRLVGWPVFVTFCARRPADLCCGDVPATVVRVLGRISRRRAVRVHAYCIMPDHLHAVVSVAFEGGDIGKWIWYVKREISKNLSAPGMWQRSYWDRHVRRDEDVVDAVSYVLENPTRKALCGVWREWPYSWSEWHSDSQGTDPNSWGSKTSS